MTTIKFLRDNLTVDQISKNKAGEFIARDEFFYRHGRTSEHLVKKVQAAIAGVTVLEHGEVWRPFRGGASVKNSSHWFVRFTINSETLANIRDEQNAPKHP